MTHASNKTLIIQITGERLVDMDNPVAVSAATQTLVFTIPGGVDFTHELLITKTGHVYSTDDIYHLSLRP